MELPTQARFLFQARRDEDKSIQSSVLMEENKSKLKMSIEGSAQQNEWSLFITEDKHELHSLDEQN